MSPRGIGMSLPCDCHSSCAVLWLSGGMYPSESPSPWLMGNRWWRAAVSAAPLWRG